MTLRTATLLAAAMTLLAGCGKPTKKMVTVTGTVTYNGRQLKAGVVKFLAPNGDFATAAIGPDGQFIMTDVVPGNQKVGLRGRADERPAVRTDPGPRQRRSRSRSPRSSVTSKPRA